MLAGVLLTGAAVSASSVYFTGTVLMGSAKLSPSRNATGGHTNTGQNIVTAINTGTQYGYPFAEARGTGTVTLNHGYRTSVQNQCSFTYVFAPPGGNWLQCTVYY